MFSFDNTTSADFAVIKDGVDTNLEIIVHKTTGFFNITKIAALVKKAKIEAHAKQPDGIPSGSVKQPRVWFTNGATTRLVEAIFRYNPGLSDVKYELSAGTPKRFAGIYLHKTAYDHFMMWFDEEYAIRVSALLESHRLAAQLEKDTKIDRLESKLDELKTINLSQAERHSAEMARQDEKIEKLLGYGKKATKDCKKIKQKCVEISDKVEDLQADVQTAADIATVSATFLEDRSKKSTLNPEQESKHHYFASTGYETKEGKRVAMLISGQKSYIEAKVATNTGKEVRPHNLLVGPVYNANPIDLRNNSQVEFIRRRADLITRVNEESKASDKEYNDWQKDLIKQFNSSAQSQITKLRAKVRAENKKPSPSVEKLSEFAELIELLGRQKMTAALRKTPKVKVGDITVDFKRSKVVYANNPYFTFDEVLKVVLDVNGATQANPAPLAAELDEIKNRDPIPTYSVDDDSDDE